MRAATHADRRTAWLALSDLYLDTEVEAFHDAIAATLAGLPYTDAELEAILLQDVHPVLRWNLLGVAGAWAGFDEAHLYAAIERALRRPAWMRRLSSRWMRGVAREQWQALAPKIAAARRQAA